MSFKLSSSIQVFSVSCYSIVVYSFLLLYHCCSFVLGIFAPLFLFSWVVPFEIFCNNWVTKFRHSFLCTKKKCILMKGSRWEAASHTSILRNILFPYKRRKMDKDFVYSSIWNPWWGDWPGLFHLSCISHCRCGLTFGRWKGRRTADVLFLNHRPL